MYLYTEAVTKNPLTRGSSEDAIEKIIMDWLNHDKDLQGGRELRRPRSPVPVQDPAEEEKVAGADAEA